MVDAVVVAAAVAAVGGLFEICRVESMTALGILDGLALRLLTMALSVKTGEATSVEAA